MKQRRLLIKVTTLAIALLVVGFGTSAHAAVKTWAGGASGSWETAASWSPSGVPAAGDDVFFPAGTVSVTISTNQTISGLAIYGDITFTTGITSGNAIQCNNLTVGDGTNPANLILERSAAGTNFVLSATGLTLNANCLITRPALPTGNTVGIELCRGESGTITMSDVATGYIASGVQSTINKNVPFASHARFDGNLTFSTAANVLIQLGNYNLYMGKDCNLTVPDSTAGTSGGFIGTYVDPANINNNPASVTNIGRLCKEVGPTSLGPFHFPVGRTNSQDKCVPIVISIASYTGSFDNTVTPFPHISVRVVDAKHPKNLQTGSYFGLYWVVQGVGTPDRNGGTVCLDLNFTYHNNYRTGSPSNLYSARYTDNFEDNVFGSGWDLTGTQSSPATGSPRLVGMGTCVPGFGDFTIGFGDPFDPGGSIPVELTSFSARYIDRSVQLNWNTATELNNFGFAVERSLDAESWEEVGFVQGYGTSLSPKSYAHTDYLNDELAYAPQLAYRLRQMDRDGTTEYSNIVFVKTGEMPAGVELYAAYPNPFNPATTISFTMQESANVNLKVYNTFGQEVATLLSNSAMDAGLHTVAFDGDKLPSGVYMAVLEANGAMQQQKLVLNK
ncbi:MAG: T9SS type A sorting domain-containing protein [Bacteroidota bacterium]|jgi:hypothetical protein